MANVTSRIIVLGSAALLAGSAHSQSEGPSWRTEQPTRPTATDMPSTDFERPEIAFEVDREALFNNPAEATAPTNQPSAVMATQPDLGRTATLRERMEGVFSATPRPAQPIEAPQAETVTEQPAPVPAEPVAVADNVVAEEMVAPPVVSDPTPVHEPMADETPAIEEEPQLLASLPPERESPIAVAPVEPLRGTLRPVSTVEPDYPREALLDRREGWVDLDVSVNADGSVEDVQVVEASPRRVFERAAVRAVSKWQFEAGVAQLTRLRIEFSLGQ